MKCCTKSKCVLEGMWKHTHVRARVFSGGNPPAYCFPLTVSSRTAPVRFIAPTETCPWSPTLSPSLLVTQPLSHDMTWDQVQAALAVTQAPGGQTLAWKEARRRDYPILGRSGREYGSIDQEGPPMETPLRHEMVRYTCLLSMADSLTLSGINPHRTSLFVRD